MFELFADEWVYFPQRFAGHLWLSLAAILTGILVSVPTGILVARSDRFSAAFLGVASIIQTIPGLALLALMVPVLGGQIGFWPAYIALALYSVLPILRNTIVGLQGVSPSVRDAALGVGMTTVQRLWLVDLPLSTPVIVAGVRTAAVWVVGAATLSTPVGAESLGNYIFAGLQTRDWAMVLFGCLASALLALSIDQAIRLLESGTSDRRRGRQLAGIAALALIILPAFSGPLISSQRQQGQTSSETADIATLDGQVITLGSKPFTEQYILTQLLKQKLEEEGASVRIRDSLGSTVGFNALVDDEIDVFIDYTGTVWATVMKRDDKVPRQRMYAETVSWLAQTHDVLALSRLGFENAYAVGLRRDQADAMNLTSIADLSGRNGLIMAGDTEFFARPEWAGVRDAYDLGGLNTRGMDSTFMYQAVQSGEVDLLTAYTTDGRIDAFDLVLLDDPKQALPPYDAFILLSPENRDNTALQLALADFGMAIPASLMRAANGRVDLSGESPEAAADWLAGEIRSRQ